MPSAPSPLHPLLEDAAFVVLDKPAGLLSVPGKGEAGRHNLWALAVAHWPQAAQNDDEDNA